MNTDALVKRLVANLAEQISALVLEKVRRELSDANKKDYRFCYSEEEAAEKLGVSKATLSRKRRNREISYSLSPSGKAVYLPRHIEEYLLRYEIRSA